MKLVGIVKATAAIQDGRRISNILLGYKMP
jgi:hypothetical protein